MGCIGHSTRNFSPYSQSEKGRVLAIHLLTMDTGLLLALVLTHGEDDLSPGD